MELIERYLQAVKFALPQQQRDDIIKELRDNLLSQVEEKEAELGHPLGEDEQAELLKKLGSPMQLASRYRKQQYMIGATMFPIYWKVLKASLGLARSWCWWRPASPPQPRAKLSWRVWACCSAIPASRC